MFQRMFSLATLLAALWLLNAALTFHNVWPTPAIELHGEWSVEGALLILGLAAWFAWKARPGRLLIGTLSMVGVVWVLARYAEVTAPALYGRGINLYWDARHIGGVVGMLLQVAPAWQVGAAAVGLLLGLVALGAVLALCIARIVRALEPGRGDALDMLSRRGLVVLASAVVTLFAFDRVGALPPRAFVHFSIPVSQTWARQFALLGSSWLAERERRAARDGGGRRDESPDPRASEALMPVLQSASFPGSRPDVYAVFVESYGAVAWERADIARRLVGSRAALAAAIARTGRGVVSAWVESPTFGSGSWLAHASLLAGTEVRDGDDYARLLLRPRTRLTDVFRTAGYRTLALMPGLRQAWPEGDWFRFDAIYGAAQLDYRGPEFGWWRIPDQFALARLEQVEVAHRSVAASRPPLFVFFPTISSHTPFRPTPPYQPDWVRLAGPAPFDADTIVAQAPDWTDLGPAYGDSIAYAQRTLAGYLERRAGEPLVMLMLGDHQPPAAVSGEGASWRVPVHIVADRQEVLEALKAHGFVAGLDPAGPAIGPMHALAPWLISALSSAARSPPTTLQAVQRDEAQAGLAAAPPSLPN